MKNEKTIYVVTSGEYSDYHIKAVFDDEELANKFVTALNDNEAAVEEFTLNPCAEGIRKGYKPYFVRMAKTGNAEEVSITTDGSIDTDARFDIQHNLIITVFARNIKHAVKIVNDKRTQLLALNMWS